MLNAVNVDLTVDDLIKARQKLLKNLKKKKITKHQSHHYVLMKQ